MPSVSKKQHSFIAAVAKNPAFAKKSGVPQSVGQEFLNADKGRKFSKGGDMKAMKKELPAFMMKGKKMASGGITTAKMGAVKTAAPSRDGMATKGKTKGTMVKMAGSKPLGMKYGGKC